MILEIYLKLKRIVFKSRNFPCKALAVDRDGRSDLWSVNRTGRPMCTRRAQRPSDLAGRPCGRPAEITPLSSGAGRPGGRPCALARSTGRSIAGTTVRKVTVGRSTGRLTGRAKLPFPAANGQKFCGAIYTTHLSCFHQEFLEQNFSSFSKFLKEFLCQKI